MPGQTDNWALPYPCAGETIDPTIFCAFSNAVDAALVSVTENAEFVANRPNARIDRVGNLNTFAAGAGVSPQFNVEFFDNNNMANLAGDNLGFVVQTPGIYWVSFSLGGFSTFTTWTRYLMMISVAGSNWVFRKFLVNTAESTPEDNTIHGVVQCQAGDTIRGVMQFIGTGGPMNISRGSLSASFICDL